MKLARVYGVEFEGKIIYVGVTKQKDIFHRFSAHKSAAKTGKSGADKLGKWLLANPLYSIKILEYVKMDERFERERYWIGFYKTIECGMNRKPYKGGANKPFRGAPGRPKGCPNPKGKDHYLSVPVKWLKTGETFSSMAEAAKKAGVSVATVCLHVNGKRQNPQFE